MPRPKGQIDRTLDALTIGVVQGKAARDKQLSYSAGVEMEQQVRVPLSGKVANGWGFVDDDVAWSFPFIWAPAQRGVEFQTPHFSYGIVHNVETEALIVVHAQVVRWTINDSSWVVGATVRFASSAPQLAEGEELDYAATAHLTFQGLGAETEEGESA